MASRMNVTSPESYIVNCSTLLTEHAVVDRAAAAARAGFTRVEFWWPFDGEPHPSDADVDAFVDSLSAAGVSLAGLNFWAGNMAGGDRGMVAVAGHRAEFADNAALAAEIGRRTGCTAFNALYGLRQGDQEPQAQDELAVENLITAAQAVAPIGGTVLVEPVSGAEAYPLKTAADALAVVEKVHRAGATNVALLADFFHMAVNGDDVAAVIEQHAPQFGHVQIADSPGRGAPGTGDLPLQEWIDLAYARGYTGSVALEYKQEQDTAFDWLRQPAGSSLG
ncbi:MULTISPECIES: hydroxypyruvate isomerase family protein [Prauserella salsuginis group]|uniref:Hydroxypyruvate isomerase family protein n=1 Tax=Prauserella salsuginis TaxID=387889 RepID=A0ABW6G3S0_9PSEU|nr:MULTISPECIES: TIM barrel protein [Prauserella salsuginis group]MCR3718721.1 hydroxypyruvate isomerase [Prauserella flava]MCR3733291.1 hydroxypyruvate isomerase [Prauserella salsuginis]